MPAWGVTRADGEDAPDPVSLNQTAWEQVRGFFLANERMLLEELCLQD